EIRDHPVAEDVETDKAAPDDGKQDDGYDQTPEHGGSSCPGAAVPCSCAAARAATALMPPRANSVRCSTRDSAQASSPQQPGKARAAFSASQTKRRVTGAMTLKQQRLTTGSSSGRPSASATTWATR